MVQIHPGPPHDFGGVAQLGERLPCTQEAIGSSPFTSTTFLDRRVKIELQEGPDETFAGLFPIDPVAKIGGFHQVFLSVL
jgi:hypothetical protein